MIQNLTPFTYNNSFPMVLISKVITEFISNQQKQQGCLFHNLMQSLLSHFKTQCCCIQKPLRKQRSDKQITFDLRENNSKQKIIEIGDIRKQYMNRRIMESIEEEHREKRVYDHQASPQGKIRASYDNIQTTDNRIEKYLEKQCQAVSRFIVQDRNEHNPYRQAIQTQNKKYLLRSNKRNRSQSKTKKLSITCVNFVKPSEMISLGGRRVMRQERILNDFVGNRQNVHGKLNSSGILCHQDLLIKRNSQDGLAQDNSQLIKRKQRRSISYHLHSLKTPSQSNKTPFPHEQHPNSQISQKPQSIIITTHSHQSYSISSGYHGQLSNSTTIEYSKASVNRWESQLEKNDTIVNVESRQYNGEQFDGNQTKNCFEMERKWKQNLTINDKFDNNGTYTQKIKRERMVNYENFEDKQNNFNLLNTFNPHHSNDSNQQFLNKQPSSHFKRVIPPSLKQTPPRMPKILSKNSQPQNSQNNKKYYNLTHEINNLANKLHQLKQQQYYLVNRLNEQKEEFSSVFQSIQSKKTQMMNSCQQRLQDIQQLVGFVYHSELEGSSQ